MEKKAKYADWFMFYLKLFPYYHSASKNPKLMQFHNLEAAKSLVVMEIKQVHGVKTIENIG